jgi:MFS family permease
MVAAVSLGMVVPLFPDAGERARALGVFSFVQAAGGSLGSLFGGVITEAVSWSWIFYLNLPIGVVTIVLALRLADDRGTRGAADALGGVLATGGLVLGVYAIVDGAPVAGAVAVVLVGLFVLRERRFAAPLLPLGVFRSVAGVNAVLGLLTAAMFAFLFFVVLHFGALGYTALGTGLAMVPVAVAIGAVSLLLSARLNRRFGERRVLPAGLVLIAAGLALLSVVTGVAAIQGAVVVLGVGFGAAMPALMGLGMATATDADAGLLSGLFNTSQQVGGALGLAVLVAVSSSYRVSFVLSACLVVAALVTAVVATRQKASDRSALSASAL